MRNVWTKIQTEFIGIPIKLEGGGEIYKRKKK